MNALPLTHARALVGRGLVLCAVAAISAPAAERFDTLIRDARVIDGTGNPWYRADVALRGDRIVAIGNLKDDTAATVVDARERVLAPGFIDVHTHVESSVETAARADNYVLDGVTTIVTGNCGNSTIGLTDWFARLDKAGLGLNIASLVGHNAVRRQVIGIANRPATKEELAKMQALVEREMASGAVGFSTGLIYIPGTYSNTEEVIEIAKAAAKHGGVYASHMRDEGVKVLDAITEAARVGQATGLRVQLSHFKIDSRQLWGWSEKTLALVEKFRADGVDVVVDQYPYERSSTNLGITLPSWALADGNDKIKARINDPATRAKIVTEMKGILAGIGQPDYSYAMISRFTPDPTLEGKTISEVNVMKGRARSLDDEIATILDLMVESRPSMIYHSMGPEDVERIMRYPFTAVASDGGIHKVGVGQPHPRSYGTNARVLAEYVRKRNILRLEDAIRRMTSLPARTFGFHDRGLVAVGRSADLVLFDPSRVQDKATFEKPHQYSEGFDHVWVNGMRMVADGKIIGGKAGRVLRRGEAAARLGRTETEKTANRR